MPKELKCEVKQGRSGWYLDWNNGFVSAMPDEATARRCAAAGEMEKALDNVIEFVESEIESMRQTIDGDEAEKAYREAVKKLAAARAALSLAFNGPCIEAK